MEKFYFSVAAGSQRLAAESLQWPDILASHSKHKAQLPRYHTYNLFIDCGGFTAALMHGDFQSTDQEYLDYVQSVGAHHFALRDYPCEPQVLQEWGRTVEEHIEMTIDRHIQLLELHSSMGLEAVPVPVLQGFELGDYLHCLDRFREQDLTAEYMAIGTLCRRAGIKDIQGIVLGIKAELNGARLHGFGVKVTALKMPGVWDALYSVDSGAWDYPARWRKHRGELSVPEASIVEAGRYADMLKKMKKGFDDQSKLGDFTEENQAPSV